MIKIYKSIKICWCAPVAQLDRAVDYESEGWGFESLQACQLNILYGSASERKHGVKTLWLNLKLNSLQLNLID